MFVAYSYRKLNSIRFSRLAGNVCKFVHVDAILSRLSIYSLAALVVTTAATAFIHTAQLPEDANIAHQQRSHEHRTDDNGDN